MVSNEQWLYSGDCELCRRNKYCSKECNARKGFIQRNVLYIAHKMAADVLFVEKR